MLLIVGELEREVAITKRLHFHWNTRRASGPDKCVHTDTQLPLKIHACHFQRCALDLIRSPGWQEGKLPGDGNSVRWSPVYGVLQWGQSSPAGRQSIVLPCPDPLRRMDHPAITI